MKLNIKSEQKLLNPSACFVNWKTSHNLIGRAHNAPLNRTNSHISENVSATFIVKTTLDWHNADAIKGFVQETKWI